MVVPEHQQQHKMQFQACIRAMQWQRPVLTAMRQWQRLLKMLLPTCYIIEYKHTVHKATLECTSSAYEAFIELLACQRQQQSEQQPSTLHSLFPATSDVLSHTGLTTVVDKLLLLLLWHSNSPQTSADMNGTWASDACLSHDSYFETHNPYISQLTCRPGLLLTE
jgi:hypothetical protein